MDEKTGIDASSILEQLENEIRLGIRGGEYTVTDVSIRVGKALSELQNKVMLDVGKIIDEEKDGGKSDLCNDCGNPLKKTAKQSNQ